MPLFSPSRFAPRILSTTIVLLLGLAGHRAQAAPLTWDGVVGAGLQDGGGNWNTTATDRWFDGGYRAWVNSATTPDSAIFGNNSGTPGTVTLTEAITAQDLTFNAVVSGNYTIASSAGSSTLTLAGPAKSVITANVAATISAVLAGTNGFTKQGAGVLTLSGAVANTLTGTVNVTAGTLTLNKTAGVNAIAGDVVIDGGILLWGASGDQIADTASITLNSGELGFSSRTETIKNLTLTGGNSNSGSGSNSGTITITDALAMSGTGSLGLNSGGQYSAATVTITGGARTVLNTTGNSSARITQVSVGAGGLSMTGQTIGINKGTGAGAFGSQLLLNGNVTATGANTISTGGGGIGASQVNLNTDVQFNITGASDTITVQPVIMGTGTLTKTGAGSLIYSGTLANTLAGLTTVTEGSLKLGKTGGAVAIAGDILVNGGTLDFDVTNQLAATTNIALSAGFLKFDSFTQTFASLTQTGGNVNSGGGTNSGIVNITGTLRASGGSTISLNSGAVWTVGKADFTGFSGTTALVLNGNTTTLNRFNVGAGGLVLSGQTLALNKATGVDNKGSELVLNGDVTASGNNNITIGGSVGVAQVNLGGAERVWNITGGTTTSNAAIVSTTITATGDDATPTAGSLRKTGAGTLTLNGANTYTGATTVEGGSLFIHGSLTGSSAVNVTSGNFGGNGVIAAPVSVSAGASLQAGTTDTEDLAISGDLLLAENSVIRLTLATGLTHSTLARTGGLWDFADNQVFTFAGSGAVGIYDNIITGLTLSSLPANFTGWTISNAGYVGTFAFDGDNVDLTLTAVPEPGAVVSLLSGLGLLVGMQRRRSRRR